jgi:hypothetical protein
MIYMIYWVAQSLSEQGKILNYNGEYVEQATSLLWVIILGVLKFLLPFELPLLGPLASWFFFFLCSIVFLNFAQKQMRLVVALLFSLLIVTSPFVVYWSISGMETNLVAFLYLVFVISMAKLLKQKITIKRLLIPSFWAGGLILVRPESIFILLLMMVLFSLFQCIYTKKYWFYIVESLKVAGVFFIIFFILTLWRFWYFGEIMPQPVIAKSEGISLEHIVSGWQYLDSIIQWKSLLGILLLIIVSLFSIRKDRYYTNGLMVVYIAICYSYLLFIVFSGGDWMEAGRFVVPIIPVFILLLSKLMYKNDMTLIFTLCGGLLIINVFDLLKLSSTSSPGTLMWESEKVYNYVLKKADENIEIDTKNYSWFELSNRVHLRDVYFIEQIKPTIELSLQEKEQITILASQAGMVFYHLNKQFPGKIQVIDRVSLVTNYFTKHPLTKNFPKKREGMTLSFEYIISSFEQFQTKMNKPDFIFHLGNLNKHEKLAKFFEENGYKLLYQQLGTISAPNVKGKVSFEQWLVVSDSLFQKFKLEQRTVFCCK